MDRIRKAVLVYQVQRPISKETSAREMMRRADGGEGSKHLLLGLHRFVCFSRDKREMR